MGWSFENRKSSKSEFVKSLVESTTGREVLKHAIKGNVLWTLVKVTRADGTTVTFIGCDLLESHKGMWGNKSMDESMGPYYWSCPLSYLDAAPVANAKWREGVREYHGLANATKALQIGSQVTLTAEYHRLEGKIFNLKPLCFMTGSGAVYKIKKTAIASVG